jgi:hypothetical protein
LLIAIAALSLALALTGWAAYRFFQVALDYRIALKHMAITDRQSFLASKSPTDAADYFQDIAREALNGRFRSDHVRRW